MKRVLFCIYLICFTSLFSEIHVYEEQTVAGQFNLPTGWFPQITAGDLDQDDLVDILYKTYDTVHHFEQVSIGSCEFEEVQSNITISGMNKFISAIDVNNDGTLELISGSAETINVYSQNAPNTYNYSQVATYSLLPSGYGSYILTGMTKYNIDNMGVDELIVGFDDISPTPGPAGYGKLALFRWESSGPEFVMFDYIDPHLCAYGSTAITDYDHDSTIDLIVASVYFMEQYEQITIYGTAFQYLDNDFDEIDNDPVSCPVFCDLNADGIDDLLVGSSDIYSSNCEIRIFIRKIWAEFSVEQLTGTSFHFTNESIGEVVEFNWDFDGDGVIDSNEENPTWEYDEPGDYTVSMEIINGEYNDIVTQNVEAVADAEPTSIPVLSTIISNHPNPFNPSTTIKYSCQNDKNVNIIIVNMKGQIIREFPIQVNKSSIEWDGLDSSGYSVSSGIYFAILENSGKILSSCKMLMLK